MAAFAPKVPQRLVFNHELKSACTKIILENGRIQRAAQISIKRYRLHRQQMRLSRTPRLIVFTRSCKIMTDNHRNMYLRRNIINKDIQNNFPQCFDTVALPNKKVR